jgi:hypothetical protein
MEKYRQSLLFLSFILICSYTSFAQIEVSIGPKGGFTKTTLSGTDAESINDKTSWFVGTFVNIKVASILSFQPEILFTERGADYISSNVRNSFSMQYIEVPLLTKLNFPIGSEVIFPHVLVGPNVAFRTNVNNTSRDTGTGVEVPRSTSDIKKVDIGGLAGIGVDFEPRGSSGIYFTVDGRYGFSFQGISNKTDIQQIKHSGWIFSVGIGFRLTGEYEGFEEQY